MQSLKSRAVAVVLRHTRKRAFSSAENLNSNIRNARRTESHLPPPGMARNFRIERREISGMPVYEVCPAEIRSRRRLLYFHGGAYVFQITPHHWRLIADLARRLGAPVTVPIYPLAPEHRFDDMFAMVKATYLSMLDDCDASDIAIVGDSAGGNMAVVLTMMLARENLPLPGAEVLISPGLDMTLENPDAVAAERGDPWLGIPGGLEAIRHYAPHIERSDWRISPIRGNLSVLPRTLMFAGMRDMLTPDNIRFADMAKTAGVSFEAVIEPGMVHVWPLIDMPEAYRARAKMADFLSRLDDQTRH